jgi:hypothetical protein
MLAVVGVWSLGDVCLLVAATLGSGGKADGLRAIGSILIEVGSLLFTLGLFGVCYDTWRLREVLSQPPLSLDDLTVERKTVEPRQPQDTL